MRDISSECRELVGVVKVNDIRPEGLELGGDNIRYRCLKLLIEARASSPFVRLPDRKRSSRGDERP
jgi:hypothetical protein